MVGLVELWSEEDDPTPRARLAQARALIELRLMDRAWLALRDVLDVPEHAAEAQRLTARMFLDRGWPKRARSELQKAMSELPDDPDLVAMWEEASKPAVDLPDGAPQGKNETLSRAEARLARGELLRAQRLLEGLRREEPNNRRVADLLWGLGGDYRLGGSLPELVERLGPDLGHMADLTDDVEHTESITAEEGAGDEEEGADPRFPVLFREPEDPVTEEYDDGEVTQARAMASTLEMMPPDALPDPADVPDGDTEILRVIEKGDRAELQKAAGDLHVNSAPLPELNFDLDAYRREMGVLDGPSHPGSDLEPLETEDNDVIVFTRREFSDSFQGLDPDPAEDTMSHPDARRFLSEEARAAADKEFMARARALAELERRAAQGGAGRVDPEEITVKTARPPTSSDTPKARRSPSSDFVARHAGVFAALVVALLLTIVVLLLAIGLRIFQEV